MRRVLLAAMLALTGCYDVTFEQGSSTTTLTSSNAPQPKQTVTYEYTGSGPVDTRGVCEHPVRTEVRVNTRDTLARMFTLFTYRPYTLYVTCER